MTRHGSMPVRSLLLLLAVMSAASAFYLQSSVQSQAHTADSHSASLSSTSSVNLQSGGGVRSVLSGVVEGVKGGISTLKTGVRHSLSEAHALFEHSSASSKSVGGFSASGTAEGAFPSSTHSVSGSGKYRISLPETIRPVLHGTNTHFGIKQNNFSDTTQQSFSSAMATNTSEMSISNTELTRGQGYYSSGSGHVTQAGRAAIATAPYPGQYTGIADVPSGFARGSISVINNPGIDEGGYIAGEEDTSHFDTAKFGIVSAARGDIPAYSSNNAGNAWQPRSIGSTVSGVHATSYGNSYDITSGHGHQAYSTGVQTFSGTADIGHATGKEGSSIGHDGSFSRHHDVSFGGGHNILASGKTGISTVANIDLSGDVRGSLAKSVGKGSSVVKSYDVPVGGAYNIYSQKEAAVSTVGFGHSGESIRAVPGSSAHDNINAFGEGFNTFRQGQHAPVDATQDNPSASRDDIFPSSNLGHDTPQVGMFEYSHRENVYPSTNVGDSFSGSRQSGILVTKSLGNSLNSGYSNSEREESRPFGSGIQTTLFTNVGSLSASGDATNSSAHNNRRYGLINPPGRIYNPPVFGEHNGHFASRNHGILGHMGIDNPGQINYDSSANYSHSLVISNFSLGGDGNHTYFGTHEHNVGSIRGSGPLPFYGSNTHLENARNPVHPATQTYSHHTYGIYSSTGGANGALSGVETANSSQAGSYTHPNGTNVHMIDGGIGDKNFHSSAIENEGHLTELENEGFSGIENHDFTAFENQKPTGSGSLNLVTQKHKDLTEFGNERGSTFGSVRTPGLSGTQMHGMFSHGAGIDTYSTVNNSSLPDAEADNSEGDKHRSLSDIGTQFGNQELTNSKTPNQKTMGIEDINVSHKRMASNNHDSSATLNYGLTATVGNSLNRPESYERTDYVTTSLAGTENHGQTRIEGDNVFNTGSDCQRGHVSHGPTDDGSHDLIGDVSHGLTGHRSYGLTGHGSYGLTGRGSHSLTGHGSRDLTSHSSHGLTSDGSHILTGYGSHSLAGQAGHDLTGHASYELTGDGSHGLTDDGSYGLTGHASDGLTGHGRHDLTGHVSHGLTVHRNHGLTDHGNHGLTGHSSHDLTNYGSHYLTGDGSHGLRGYGSHGSHGLTGHGNHDLTSDGSDGLTNDGSHGLTGEGSHGLTGFESHALSGSGNHELVGARGYTAPGFEAERHVHTGFGSHGLMGARGYSVTGFKSYRLTGGKSHGLINSGDHSVTGVGSNGATDTREQSDRDYTLTGAGSHSLTTSGNDGVENSRGQVLTNTGGQLLTHFDTQGLPGIDSHRLTDGESHDLYGTEGQIVTGSGGYGVTSSKVVPGFESHGSTDARGHSALDAGVYGLAGFNSYKHTGAGSYSFTGTGDHELTSGGGNRPESTGSHGRRAPGSYGSLNVGGQVVTNPGGHAVTAFESPDLTAIGGHGLRLTGGHRTTGVGRHDQTGFVSHGLTGARSHGVKGVGDHSVVGALNLQSSAGSHYLNAGLSSSHSLKEHSETHGHLETHTSEGGARTSGSSHNSHSVDRHSENQGHLETHTAEGGARTSQSLYNTHSVDEHNEAHGHMETHVSEGERPVSQSTTGITMPGGKSTFGRGASSFRVGVKG